MAEPPVMILDGMIASCPLRQGWLVAKYSTDFCNSNRLVTLSDRPIENAMDLICLRSPDFGPQTSKNRCEVT